MSTADRKAELERKKAKLQQMREEKKRKEEEKKRATQVEDVSGKDAAKGGADLRSETDRMLQDLGIPPDAVSAPKSSPPSQGSQDSGDHAPTSLIAHTSSKHKTTLTMSKTSQTSIPPKETVSYSKETQTPQMQIDKEDDDNDSLDVAVHTPPAVNKMPQVEPVKPAHTQEDDIPPVKEERVLSDEEKTQIMNSEDFKHFLDRSSRVLERALSEKVDIFTDYAGGEEGDQEGGLQEGEKLKLSRQFYDERWSKHRTVTCLDWSAQHPELLVASYNNNEDAPHEPDGVCLIWNLKYKKTSPEYIFHCQSAVMSSCFAKFHPNLVVGGTYSGQIVLWDNRSNKRTPAQRTPLSAAAHTHPVYCVNVVGTQNAHNLISVSTDGKMCSWSLDMLSAPQDSMELQHKQSKAVAVTSMSFLSGDVNNFVVGSEEGAVYTACRHGSKAGIADMFEGHQGPVTGIDSHTVPGQIDFSHYFLSSSFDWTIKLWNMKDSKPLHSFEDNSDYVYDVKWSPIHPSVFASVDGMGRLDLWNLNHDIEVPIASSYVENNVSLNRCRWHQTGHQIAVGDDLGKIHIYDVGEHVAAPRSDDWNKFVHTLQDIRNNQSDQDDDGSLASMSSPLR